MSYIPEDMFMLPITEYTDSSALQKQVDKVFKVAPEYLGHALMAPNLNDQFPLPTAEESCFLIHTNEGFKVYVNSCPHRSKKIVTEKKNAVDIHCSTHHFVYRSSGELIIAPHFDSCPNLKLHAVDVTSIHGMLFRTPESVDLGQWFFDVPDKVHALLNMSGYKFCEGINKSETIIGGHWLLVMELTDDLLHIPHVHPSLNKLLKIESVTWECFNNGFIQTLDFNRSLLFMDEKALINKLSKPIYAPALRYIKVLRKIIALRPDLADDPSLHHLYLISLFPGMQVETLPFLRIIENTKPHTTNTSSQILEYYYKDDLPEEFESELIEASIEFFTQFDDEDDLLSKDEQEGIEFLARFGIKDRGTIHPTLEAGAQYRHVWIGQKLGLI